MKKFLAVLLLSVGLPFFADAEIIRIHQVQKEKRDGIEITMVIFSIDSERYLLVITPTGSSFQRLKY